MTRGDVHTVREGDAWVNRVEGAGSEAGRYRRKVEAWVDGRDYADAARILHDLGATSVRLMTNNPDKCRALADHGIAVTERIALEAPPNPHNAGYLAAKRDRMGHQLPDLTTAEGARP